MSYPTTGFSFHALEGIITGGFNPFLAYALHFNKETVIVAQMYGLINTLFVHLGYEVVPLRWNKSFLTGWYLSSQFHDVHHQKINCNFGGFTTIYDHIFGTVHPNFRGMVETLEEHVNSKGTSPLKTKT